MGEPQVPAHVKQADAPPQRYSKLLKDQSKDWSFSNLERVTRLELATSTLARWRSTK